MFSVLLHQLPQLLLYHLSAGTYLDDVINSAFGDQYFCFAIFKNVDA